MVFQKLFRKSSSQVSHINENASPEEIERRVNQLLQQAEEKSLSSVQRRKWLILLIEKRLRTGFERRLHQRWGKAFRSFDVFRKYALDIGQHLQRDRKLAENLVQDYTYEALFRLHARSCLVASEVRALMASGHASGALTRWRTLHELAVTSFFLKGHSPDAAERYLLHSHVKLAKHMRKYQASAEKLGFEPFSRSEVADIESEYDLLIERFGVRFADDYGWASPIIRGKIRFDQLEKAVGLDHWRPFYSLASESVHGGFRGMVADIGHVGMVRANQLMLAGPSNAGLADPGQSAAISLSQCTTALVNYSVKPEYLVMMKVLHRLMDVTVNDFIQAHDKLERDEKRYSLAD